MVVVRSDALNASPIATVMSVPLAGSLKLLRSRGNVHLTAAATSLRQGSVANVAAICSSETGPVLADQHLLTIGEQRSHKTECLTGR